MDTSEMQELLRGYLDELDWSGGVTKPDLVAKLDGRDEALRSLVGQYVADGVYRSPTEVLNVIPAQGWQDVQGDAWRGGEVHDMADMPSHYQEGPVGQDDRDINRRGDPTPPPTPGFGDVTATDERAGGGGPGTTA